MPFHRIHTLTEPWWQRQPDESLTAYHRFCQFRDTKRGDRSLGVLAESFGRDPRTIQQQASAHRWQGRASAIARDDALALPSYDQTLSTIHGSTPVQDIEAGDYVLTSNGYLTSPGHTNCRPYPAARP